MKFSTVATVFAISTLAAAKGGDKDHNKPSTITEYVTETTHKYGRFDKTKRPEEPKETGTHKYGKFNKTPRPVTKTVLVQDGDIPKKREAVVARDSKNSSSNSTTSSGNNGVSTGVSLGLAGVLAVGAALVI
ncbi:conserved hypothetical protein [Candida dubliniensis CD36]|uniref:Hydrophilin n=1 Tax=Candida dubliniensis (strain CD36 / ATCC MYA-646 / CBS 7987 / NCPF 3949 / NRRL Y-17841) TaxID=573826 RepID=B9WGX3_CANDC|nr:conserved hypothetical protein [Candida dubliniensis CD36]CAX41411.1 conserved hypothetical protein [Candida dubliniensis CD36]